MIFEGLDESLALLFYCKIEVREGELLMFYPQMQNFGQLMRPPGIQYVNNIESAKAYQMGPNQEALLMDSSEPVFYVKTTDASGQFAIKAYEFREKIIRTPESDFAEIRDRLIQLEKKLTTIKEVHNESATETKHGTAARPAGPVQENA